MSAPTLDPTQAAQGLSSGVLNEVLLPLSLAVLMFGMGLGLRGGDFRAVITRPRGLLLGLAGQLLWLPIAAMVTAVLLIETVDLEPAFAIGLLVLGAAPGGATSNVLTFLARGDTALSIALTTITSLGAVVLVPGVLYTTTWLLSGSGSVIQVAFQDVMLLALFIIGLPVLAGMLVGRRHPDLADRADRPLRIGGLALLALLIGLIVYDIRADFAAFAAATLPAVLLLNGLALAGGFAIARLGGLPEAQVRTLTIEVGFQNGTFAIILAITQLGSSRIALVPAFYGLFMFATGAWLVHHWGRREPAPPEAPSLQAPLLLWGHAHHETGK